MPEIRSHVVKTLLELFNNLLIPSGVAFSEKFIGTSGVLGFDDNAIINRIRPARANSKLMSAFKFYPCFPLDESKRLFRFNADLLFLICESRSLFNLIRKHNSLLGDDFIERLRLIHKTLLFVLETFRKVRKLIMNDFSF